MTPARDIDWSAAAWRLELAVEALQRDGLVIERDLLEGRCRRGHRLFQSSRQHWSDRYGARHQCAQACISRGVLMDPHGTTVSITHAPFASRPAAALWLPARPAVPIEQRGD